MIVYFVAALEALYSISEKKCLSSIFLYNFSHVLPMLSYFQTRSIKQTTVFRGPLEIGTQLKINVYGYNRVHAYMTVIFIACLTH